MLMPYAALAYAPLMPAAAALMPLAAVRR